MSKSEKCIQKKKKKNLGGLYDDMKVKLWAWKAYSCFFAPATTAGLEVLLYLFTSS